MAWFVHKVTRRRQHKSCQKKGQVELVGRPFFLDTRYPKIHLNCILIFWRYLNSPTLPKHTVGAELFFSILLSNFITITEFYEKKGHITGVLWPLIIVFLCLNDWFKCINYRECPVFHQIDPWLSWWLQNVI